MKILVVEDEPACLKLAHLVLTQSGHEVSQATAAEVALDAIAAGNPDAILLDLELPGIDGLTLARQLKAAETTRHIAVVALTAFPERYPKEAVMAAGCDAYLNKPINTRQLPQQMEAALLKRL